MVFSACISFLTDLFNPEATTRIALKIALGIQKPAELNSLVSHFDFISFLVVADDQTTFQVT